MHHLGAATRGQQHKYIYEIHDCKTIIYRQPLSMGYLIPRLVISLSKKTEIILTGSTITNL
jgi:hypothetical protein